MNWKVTFIGGIAYYITTWIVSFGTGTVVHNNILVPTYINTASFWRPELNSVPPNMAALMPLWLTTSLVASLIFAALYSLFSPALKGRGWQRGFTFGIAMSFFIGAIYLSLFGVFNLPINIWIWWTVEAFVILAIGGIVLGWVSEKVSASH